MTGRPLFDITKASAMLERLCSELIAQQGEGITLEWLKLGDVHRDRMAIHGRMRKVVSGHYLDVQLSCLSMQALAWLEGVGSKSVGRSSWDEAFDTDAHHLMRVITRSLKAPVDEWSPPVTRRLARQRIALGGRSGQWKEAPHQREFLADLAGLNVLVVDGERHSLERLVLVLEASGARVHPAPDAARARETIDVQTPSLMLADLSMPDPEGGCSLIESVRNMPSREKRRIPAIALGSFTQAIDVARARRAGFDMHISKPIEPHALTRAVAQLATPAIVLG